MSRLSRREFVVKAAAVAAAMQLPAGTANSQQGTGEPAATTAATQQDRQMNTQVALRWLDAATPAQCPGTTWGVPWPRGAVQPDQQFALRDANGQAIAMQSWPTAYWPDGSLKWTAHAISPASGQLSERYVIAPGPATQPQQTLTVHQSDEAIEIDTGVIRCRIRRSGESIIESIDREGKAIARGARLVCLRRNSPEPDEQGQIIQQQFIGSIQQASVEQSGPLRAVVRIEGRHVAADGRAWLPFVLRLYLYAGSEAVRIMHTFIFDGDEQADFISGLGVRFDVPMRDELHDRHVRFVGEGSGLFGEAIRGLTGLRRNAGEQARRAQVAGEPTPPVQSLPESVRTRLQFIPAWGDYTLSQLCADGFQIRKRTKMGHGWISAGAGRRASGVGYIGGVSGGVVFGLRDFWQRHPTQLDIRNAATDQAQVTIWLFSPQAPPMDLRFYHDGMGMQTHRDELEGLEITYEDYEKGFGTPVGIARTSEMMLWALPATPSRQRMIDMADAVRKPPLLVCAPEHYVATQVFGGLFSVPDRSTPARARIEDRLDFFIEYYQKQIEQHRWYGFWDFGDVMHSYDPDRHVWRYDVGGYAWDNSELSPDLWLWYSFLRTGRADIFRMAEAMTRHTGEVDVYHLGRFEGLGSRHNVQHWGCSAKQVRISTAAYRRFYYFLTADERVGDLLREQVDSDQTFLTLDPIRKIRREPYTPQRNALAVGFGTDWGSLAAAWLTEWERTGQARWRDRLLNSMRSIGSMPHGFFTRGALFDLDSGAFWLKEPGDPGVGVSHLSAVFGLVEICAELIMLLDVPEFERAWLQYCELYNATPEEQRAALGQSLSGTSLRDAHSRLSAYAARRKSDRRLAERAWRELLGRGGLPTPPAVQRIEGPHVLNPIDEVPWVSTNSTSQWSLAAIQNLALAGEAIPEPG
ncbi:Tat pathway signal sequence domain protein [Fontivita pretiosa]|uniref:exo-rhamnogalacturonan lyase family protein n=1 Tax=Fontivita pretiosa TaxID=2989684 RepID=UPI003D1642FE